MLFSQNLQVFNSDCLLTLNLLFAKLHPDKTIKGESQ